MILPLTFSCLQCKLIIVFSETIKKIILIKLATPRIHIPQIALHLKRKHKVKEYGSTDMIINKGLCIKHFLAPQQDPTEL